MAEIFGLEIKDLKGTPLEAVVLVRYLDENGEQKLDIRVTDGLLLWDVIGMLEGYAFESKMQFFYDGKE